jgi:hypothetical protein
MKAFFLSRQFREKILLVGLILMLAVTWFSSVSRRTVRWWNEFRVTSGLLAGQHDMLAQADRVEAEAKAAIQNLEPSKTIDGVR